MPDKTGRFTAREQIFIEHYSATGDAVYAAEKAGYSSARQAASQNTHNPAIIAECRQRAVSVMATEILPMATRRHAQILGDQSVKGAPLNKAIELAYKYGLTVMEGLDSKPAHELSGVELAASVELGRQVISAMEQRLRLIEHDAEEAHVVHVPSAFD